jgi:hypothetical protein
MSRDMTFAIDNLVAEANNDADLRARLLADPRGTIGAETGMTVPDDWAIIAHESNGMVELAFENNELPEDYLELVAGGVIIGAESCPWDEGH